MTTPKTTGRFDDLRNERGDLCSVQPALLERIAWLTGGRDGDDSEIAIERFVIATKEFQRYSITLAFCLGILLDVVPVRIKNEQLTLTGPEIERALILSRRMQDGIADLIARRERKRDARSFAARSNLC